MISSARIEAAARAMWFEYCDELGWPNGQPTWDELVTWTADENSPESVRWMIQKRELIRRQAESGLRNGFPELAGPTPSHWLAPTPPRDAP